jgi:hypothetical protein
MDGVEHGAGEGRLVSSAFLTLLVIPIVYSWLCRNGIHEPSRFHRQRFAVRGADRAVGPVLARRRGAR